MGFGLWFMEDFKASYFDTPKASAEALTLKINFLTQNGVCIYPSHMLNQMAISQP